MSDPTTSPYAWQAPRESWSSGMVTAGGVPPLEPSPPPDPEPPRRTGPQRQRRQLMIFGGVAGLILAAGLTVLLVVLLGGDGDPFRKQAAAPVDDRPPLARACPPPNTSPSAEATRAPVKPPPVTGARTVDEAAGISYREYGEPWETWTDVWRAGTLQVPYRVGQHFVTETYSQGTYHASILSAAVPATTNDSTIADLECVGRQIVADVRAGYYPQPNTVENLRDELTTLGGLPAWVSEFRLRFREVGLTATDERSAVAVIDVGKPTAAVLYVSIPGTHKRFDYVLDDVLKSVRPL